MNKVRYGFAVAFILVGSLIIVLGSYSTLNIKHYTGELSADDVYARQLVAMYPDNVEIGAQTVQYDIIDKKDLQLLYTTSGWLLWIFIPIGLAYAGLGTGFLINERLLFRIPH